MTPAEILDAAINPAMELLGLPLAPRTAVQMLAIGLQESRFTHRYQVVDGGGKGPARGFWQFERGGGVKGVLTHSASREMAIALCGARGVPADPQSVWLAMETDDVLAAGFARLLLFTDPQPIPDVSDVDGAWSCYVRNWRPGKPHRDSWDALHAQAVAAVGI